MASMSGFHVYVNVQHEQRVTIMQAPKKMFGKPRKKLCNAIVHDTSWQVDFNKDGMISQDWRWEGCGPSFHTVYIYIYIYMYTYLYTIYLQR